MKTAILLSYACCLAASAFAAPHFVTPAMTYRNGLTDEQYELLWKQGKNPRIGIAEARDWIFRSSRYGNVTNWLGIIGKTNDFARLVVPTMEKNEQLTATNAVLVHAVGKFERDLEDAKHGDDIYKALQKAAKRTEKNREKVIKELEKAKKKASTEEEAALYSAIIAVLEGKEPNTL